MSPRPYPQFVYGLQFLIQYPLSLSYAYDAENKDSMDFGTIGSGESEIFKVDFAEMQPVGQKFRIKLKE